MTEFHGKIGHLEGIESPFGNAGGVVKTVEDVEVMARTGVGWIEAGSYTLESRLGNAWNPETQQMDRVVYYHDAQAGKTYNSRGMPNKGFDVVEAELPEMVRIARGYSKPLVVNIAPVSDNPVEEVKEMTARAYEQGVDAVLVNAGCSNVVSEDGGRHELRSHHPSMQGLVIAGRKEEERRYRETVGLRVLTATDYGRRRGGGGWPQKGI